MKFSIKAFAYSFVAVCVLMLVDDSSARCCGGRGIFGGVFRRAFHRFEGRRAHRVERRGGYSPASSSGGSCSTVNR